MKLCSTLQPRIPSNPPRLQLEVTSCLLTPHTPILSVMTRESHGRTERERESERVCESVCACVQLHPHSVQGPAENRGIQQSRSLMCEFKIKMLFFLVALSHATSHACYPPAPINHPPNLINTATKLNKQTKIKNLFEYQAQTFPPPRPNSQSLNFLSGRKTFSSLEEKEEDRWMTASFKLCLVFVVVRPAILESCVTGQTQPLFGISEGSTSPPPPPRP